MVEAGLQCLGKIEDASGQAVKDAVVSLPSDASPYGDPWMPVHRHGSSILPMVTNNGDGTATLVNDTMNGDQIFGGTTEGGEVYNL